MRMAGLIEARPSRGAVRDPAGVTVTVEAGRVVACQSSLATAPATFAVGSVAHWFDAVRHGSLGGLRFGGGRQLAEGLVRGLHSALSSR